MKNPWDDVSLSDGAGFMTTEGPYKEHLKVAQEAMEVCDASLVDNRVGPSHRRQPPGPRGSY